MQMPLLKPIKRKSNKFILDFQGYNANPVINDGEIRSMKNLSSSYYPCLAPRNSRDDIIELDHNYGDTVIPVEYTATITAAPNNYLFTIDKDFPKMPTKDWYYSDDVRCPVRIKVATTELNINDTYYIVKTAYGYALHTTRIGAGNTITFTSGEGFIFYEENTQININSNDFILVDDKMFWIDGNHCYFGTTEEYEYVGTLNVIEGVNRSLACMGDRIVIFPDKMYFNIASKHLGSLEGKITLTDILYVHHNIIGFLTSSEDQSNGDAFIKEGDTVIIDGFTAYTNSIPEVIDLTIYNNYAILDFPSRGIGEDGTAYTGISQPWGSEIYGTHRVQKFADNTFSIDFNSDVGNPCTDTVTIERLCPDIDFVISNDNRLWGIKGNNIYASALGDPFNWNKFEVVNTDSYATDVDTNGSFTGAAVYNGNPVFFKEDYIHRIYGDLPSNYQLQTTQAYGLQSGAYKTLVNINDTLFYMSNIGIMVYQGGYPQLISANFGNTKYKGNAGGTDGRKYYISLQNLTTNIDTLFVFDTINKVWHIEDDLKATKFSYSQGVFLMMNATVGAITQLDTGTEVVAWEAVLGDFDEVIDNKKGYSRLSIKVELDPLSEISIYIKCDFQEWQGIKTITSTEKRYYSIPIQPNRCNSFSIKLTGKGMCKVYSLIREFYYGGY